MNKSFMTQPNKAVAAAVATALVNSSNACL